MRTPIAVMTFACITLGSAATQAASPALPQPMPTNAAVVPATQADQEFGVREETPNQRRRRLGQPIVASYPPPEYGEALETPNQRRHRLGIPIVAADETQNSGVAEETPNHRRQRLGQPLPQ